MSKKDYYIIEKNYYFCSRKSKPHHAEMKTMR